MAQGNPCSARPLWHPGPALVRCVLGPGRQARRSWGAAGGRPGDKGSLGFRAREARPTESPRGRPGGRSQPGHRGGQARPGRHSPARLGVVTSARPPPRTHKRRGRGFPAGPEVLGQATGQCATTRFRPEALSVLAASGRWRWGPGNAARAVGPRAFWESQCCLRLLPPFLNQFRLCAKERRRFRGRGGGAKEKRVGACAGIARPDRPLE